MRIGCSRISGLVEGNASGLLWNPRTASWREYLMLTQSEMAERMGITQAGYAQIEAAKRPRKATLQKAAEALGITLEQLAY